MTQLIPRAPRREIASPVALRFDDTEERCRGLSVNLSTTGMLVRADEPRPPGTPISFAFALFHGRGEVAWSVETEDEGALLGFKFLSIERRKEQAGYEQGTSRSERSGKGPGFADVVKLLVKRGVPLNEIAYTLGEPTNAVRRGLLDPSSPKYRPPPDDWRRLLASLARGRGERLERVARQLEAASRPGGGWT